MAWILVLSPPRERPIAWSVPLFGGAGAMLMGAHDGGVDHRIFVVGIRRQMLEHLRPNPRLGPSAEATMHLDAIAETLRQVTPRNTGAEPVQHRFDEEPVVPCRYPASITARQQVAYPLPFVVPQAVTPHRSAPDSLTAYESSFVQPGIP